MFSTLARKVSAALVAILVSTMLLTAIFGYYKFGDVLSAQVSSRYSFVVFTIKKKLEDSLNLGFALRQLRQAQDTVEREKVRDANILGIEIFDAKGEILFNTDRGAIGGFVPPNWLPALEGPANQPFTLVDEDNLVVGLPLVNNLGKVEGGVALRYPVGYLEREMGELLGQLALLWLVVLAVFIVIAAFGAMVMFRPVGRRLAAMEAALADGAEPDPDLGAGYNQFVEKTRETAQHLRDATQDVERLDRLA